MTIKDLRKNKFRTAAEFASVLGLPSPRVRKWENGTAKPRTDDLRIIAEALDVSVDDLLDCFKESRK